ncbi:MAG: MBOAT family protein, partial [Opitutae bacterium]|nr:MBOAT family protein [Opitutae bacterium]
GSGLLIERARNENPLPPPISQNGKSLSSSKGFNWSKFFCGANIVVNLAILGVFKYYDFFVREFVGLVFGGNAESWLINVILPVGISFYTFQALSYSIDVYRKNTTATRDIVQFFAYVSFFPQLVAGPIERSTNLLPQFAKERHFDYAQAADGMRQMLWGFFKKMVIADNCAQTVDAVWDNYSTLNGSCLVVAALLFTFQIYGDFSGYSDIAIGCSRLFGISLKKNFNFPYFSRDIAEFWRRWHISLNTWFRDYLYIPLGGSRVSTPKVIRNTLIIFLVCGFWHGANWTFIAWGAFNALLFIPLLLRKTNRKNLDVVAANAKFFPSCREFFQVAVTFALVVCGWVIFRAPTIGDVGAFFNQMLFSGTLLTNPLAQLHDTMNVIHYPTMFVIVLVIAEWFARKHEHALAALAGKNAVLRWAVYLVIAHIILKYGGTSTQFIYFQF